MLEQENFEVKEEGVTVTSPPDVNNQNDDQNLQFNKSKELDRKLEEVNRMLAEAKAVKSQEKQVEKLSEQEFLLKEAKAAGFVDVDGEVQVEEFGKIMRVLERYNLNYVQPKFEGLMRQETVRGFNDYEEYKQDIDGILNNELSSVPMPAEQKVKIAYEMAKGRRPIVNNAVTQPQNNNRPSNMNRSSINTSSSSKSKIPAADMAEMERQASALGLKKEKLIEQYKICNGMA